MSTSATDATNDAIAQEDQTTGLNAIRTAGDGTAAPGGEENYRALFEEAPIPYHEIDANGLVCRINTAECELLQVRPEDVLGRPVWEMVSPAEREASRLAVARKLREGQPIPPYERTYRGGDGVDRIFEFHERVVRTPEGEVAGIRTAMIDLTASKRAQRQIAFQAGLLDQVNDGIVAVDEAFRIIYWNRAAERLFGRRAADVLGTDYGEAVQDSLDDEQRARRRLDLVEKGSLCLEFVCQHSSGPEVYIELSATVLRDENGQPCGAVGIHRDITQRRHAELALAESEGRFRMAQRALGIGNWEVDVRSGKVTSSPENRSLYGIDGNDTRFDTLDAWRQRIHPDDRERVAHEFGSDSLQGAANREFRVVWPDGSVHWILSRTNVVFDREHQPVRVVGMNLDVTAEKTSAERLRILSSVVEQSPLSIILTDPQGTIQYVNPKTVEITGYSEKELIGQNPRILKSGETTPAEYQQLWNTLSTGIWRGVFHNRKKDGELFWEAATIGPIRDESGTVTHYLGIGEDITEKRKIEAALRFSEERFRVAAQSSGDVVYEWDLISDEVQVIGRDNAQIPTDDRGRPVSGSDFLSRIHPDDRARVRASIHRNLAAGEPYQETYRVIFPSGEIRYWADSGSAIRDASGSPIKWVGVCKDTTEAKAAERANAEMAAIVESAETAVVSRDLRGTVLAWNAGAERIYGYTASEMIGRNVSLTVPKDRMGELEEVNLRIRDGQRISHMETVRLTKSGEQVEVLMTAIPVRNLSGEVTGAAHMVWDITEFRQLQRQLSQAQKLESVGRLAAGVAHEINTPIQYVGDNASFLSGAFRDLARPVEMHGEIVQALRSGANPELADRLARICEETDVDFLCREIPAAIDQLSQGAQQVAHIVRAMKEFSHPGSAEKVMLDLNRAIESTILVCRNEWKYVAELTPELDPVLPPVPCLAGEFNQVMLNLIVNAAHAISDVVGGSGRKGAIGVATRRNGRWAEVRVSDTGTGIPEAIRSKVFDPFFTTKAVGKGTGQGLAIAHDVIVKKHAGTLSFETRPGAGTTFIIQLPLEQTEIS